MKKALIVGLNKYPGCELACCSNDAVAMKELIESNGDGSPNFDVVAITDSCTKKNLKIHIEKLFADDADIALLYFPDMVRIVMADIFVPRILRKVIMALE